MSDNEHHGHGPSTKSLLLILMGTFVFGFITGAVLFLQNNTGKEGDGGIENNVEDVIVIAYMYGGCESLGCPSYRITGKGSYMYVTRAMSEGGVRHEGSLESTEYNTFRAEFKATDFTRVQSTKFEGTCPIVFDGVAYRYDITILGERYLLDSCSVSLDTVPLFDLLAGYFELFGARTSTE